MFPRVASIDAFRAQVRTSLTLRFSSSKLVEGHPVVLLRCYWTHRDAERTAEELLNAAQAKDTRAYRKSRKP